MEPAFRVLAHVNVAVFSALITYIGCRLVRDLLRFLERDR